MRAIRRTERFIKAIAYSAINIVGVLEHSPVFDILTRYKLCKRTCDLPFMHDNISRNIRLHILDSHLITYHRRSNIMSYLYLIPVVFDK